MWETLEAMSLGPIVTKGNRERRELFEQEEDRSDISRASVGNILERTSCSIGTREGILRSGPGAWGILSRHWTGQASRR